MQVTWRPPTATAPRSCCDGGDHQHDHHGHGIRSWRASGLCRLRHSIPRGPILPKAWASAAALRLPGFITNEHHSHQQPAQLPAATPSPHSRQAGGHSDKVLPKMTLTDLPYTIFVEIISHLSAREAVAARRISRPVRAALTRDELSITLLLLHLPRSRESQALRRLLRRPGERSHAQLEQVDWSAAFAAAARRYHHLGSAAPRRTETVAVLRDAGLLRGVTPWNRFLRLDDKTAAFHYWDPTWSCDAGRGLLVYPATDRRAYRLRDLQTGWEGTVPFDTSEKVMRRVRISHGILVLEWCELQASLALNDEELAHRHFATAYDITRTNRTGHVEDEEFDHLRPYNRNKNTENDSADTPQWDITFRAEWKIHYLGLLLSHQDRFFSTHNSTHYVVYIWQPTRSPWGEDGSLERLIIWELGEPDPYRPSLDPASSLADDDAPSAGGGPRIIAKLTNPQLEHWGVRQNDTPSLRCLYLDDCTRDPATGAATGHVFLVEEEHRWSAGPHSRHNPPRLHHVRSTGIPLADGALCGPRWLDECGQEGPETSQMQFCWRGHQNLRYGHPRAFVDDEGEVREPATQAITQAPSSPQMETWPGRCPCWRHDDFPYLTVCEVNDTGAGVRFSARHCFMLETLSVNIKPRLRIHGVERPVRSRRASHASLSNTSSNSGARSGKQAAKGPRRSWGEARVRSVARRYAGDGAAAATEQVQDARENAPAAAASHNGGATLADGPGGQEIQFADDVWAKLMGAGFIAGDERWLIGQDGNGDVTVMYF